MSDDKVKIFSAMRARTQENIARQKADEYTPMTEDVRNDYCEARWEGFPHVSAEHYGEKFGAGFDRWLTEHDREVAEKAWDECMKKVRYEMRAIPSCGDGQGGKMFDLLPLGPNEASESGARTVVFEALHKLTNPYREGATS